MRPCEAGLFFGFEAPKKAKSSKNACTCALARSHKHDGADRKRARRVEVGAEEEVVDGHTQRAPRECGVVRGAPQPARRRESTGAPVSMHESRTARRSTDAADERDDAKACHGAEAERVPAKAQPHHVVSRRQAGAWQTNHSEDALLPAAGEEIFHLLAEKPESCEIESSGGEPVTHE